MLSNEYRIAKIDFDKFDDEIFADLAMSQNIIDQSRRYDIGVTKNIEKQASTHFLSLTA